MEALLDEIDVYDRFLSTLSRALWRDPEQVLSIPAKGDLVGAPVDAPGGTEVLGPLAFDFLTTKELRQIAERDKTELITAYRSGLWKSVLLLCGGLTEAMLCDSLYKRDLEAQTKFKERWPTKKPRDLLEWDLYDLTTIAGDLGEVSPDAASLANTLRGWRNLIHPGKEARGVIKPEQEEADLAVHMIRLLARDLSRRGPTLDQQQ